MKFIRVNKKRRCPLCGRDHDCSIREDGAIYCRKTPSDKVSRDGRFVHLPEGDRRAPRPVKVERPSKPEPQKIERSPEDLNTVYSHFLNRLNLKDRHEADLKNRGLGLVDIHLHGYKTMPSRAESTDVCRQMGEAGFVLSYVPGFYLEKGKWHFVDYGNAEGFLVPIRNCNHQIIGMQLRKDNAEGGKYCAISSGWKHLGGTLSNPPHFAAVGIVGRYSDVREIIVTEGVLKANIIAEYRRVPTIGLIGVNFKEDFPQLLKETYPNLEYCELRFDNDMWTNETVARQVKKLKLTLEKLNLRAEIRSFDENYKGYDDYLAAQNRLNKRLETMKPGDVLARLPKLGRRPAYIEGEALTIK